VKQADLSIQAFYRKHVVLVRTRAAALGWTDREIGQLISKLHPGFIDLIEPDRARVVDGRWFAREPMSPHILDAWAKFSPTLPQLVSPSMPKIQAPEVVK
jgi:hypothetical protein